jgi:hypothetical protein
MSRAGLLQGYAAAQGCYLFQHSQSDPTSSASRFAHSSNSGHADESTSGPVGSNSGFAVSYSGLVGSTSGSSSETSIRPSDSPFSGPTDAEAFPVPNAVIDCYGGSSLGVLGHHPAAVHTALSDFTACGAPAYVFGTLGMKPSALALVAALERMAEDEACWGYETGKDEIDGRGKTDKMSGGGAPNMSCGGATNIHLGRTGASPARPGGGAYKARLMSASVDANEAALRLCLLRWWKTKRPSAAPVPPPPSGIPSPTPLRGRTVHASGPAPPSPPVFLLVVVVGDGAARGASWMLTGQPISGARMVALPRAAVFNCSTVESLFASLAVLESGGGGEAGGTALRGGGLDYRGEAARRLGPKSTRSPSSSAMPTAPFLDPLRTLAVSLSSPPHRVSLAAVVLEPICSETGHVLGRDAAAALAAGCARMGAAIVSDETRCGLGRAIAGLHGSPSGIQPGSGAPPSGIELSPGAGGPTGRAGGPSSNHSRGGPAGDPGGGAGCGLLHGVRSPLRAACVVLGEGLGGGYASCSAVIYDGVWFASVGAFPSTATQASLLRGGQDEKLGLSGVGAPRGWKAGEGEAGSKEAMGQVGERGEECEWV